MPPPLLVFGGSIYPTFDGYKLGGAVDEEK